MKELVTITEKDGQQIVSARELHQFLEIETPLHIWALRMFEYGFTQHVDYQCLNKNVQTPNGGTREVFDDYALTLDTAKEISMIQRSEKGKEARQYFIACEKKLKEIAPRTHLEVLDSENASILQASGKTNVCELFTL
jgi:anti-repressor protein